jgi:hypothetical protein
MKRASIFLLGTLVWLGATGPLMAQEPLRRSTRGDSSTNAKSPRLPLPVELDSLPETTRDSLNKVLRTPTLTAVSNADEFPSTSNLYLWLLDHPDRVSLAWQRLRISAIDIKAQQDGKFVWKDDQGSELSWRTVAQSGEGRIWYAEGKVRASAVLPNVPVKAVAVLRHGLKKDEDGEALICHQVEIYLQTDSRAAALVMRLLGPAVPHMAQDGAEQMLLFFSGIARHLDRHPSRTKALLAEKP